MILYFIALKNYKTICPHVCIVMPNNTFYFFATQNSQNGGFFLCRPYMKIFSDEDLAVDTKHLYF
jgi:hypothetical protein